MAELPPKLFFRIGEVAELVGVEPHVLRYWEREFRSIRPTKSAKGQRVYSRKDVENLLRVRELLYRDGFTIAGAKKKMQRGVGAELALAPPAADAQSEAEPEVVSEPDEAGCQPVAVVGPEEEAPARLREKLVALRSEVEAFLAELATDRR